MTILSVDFFILFFLTFLVVAICPQKVKWIPLFICNTVFIFSLGLSNFLILMCYVVVSFTFGILIEKTKWKKVFFVTGLFICSIFLIVFKSLTFNLNFINLLPGFLIEYKPIVLPVGMAYYSLVTIAYLVDVYQKTCRAEINFLKYYIHISNFLKLYQGPIELYSNTVSSNILLIPPATYNEIAHGAQLVLWGLFKKAVIADWLSIPVASIFDNDTPYGSIILFGAVLFYIQLYCDFSGCVDIVTGLGNMLGLELPKNFEHPFFATSVTDFWHRWHISLSDWLKKYIYIPLGGNRKGKKNTYLNIFIVFLVSGFWHGSGIKFFAWGLFHAFFQCLEKICKSKSRKLEDYRKSRFTKIVITFVVISLSWIFFRGNGFINSLKFYKRIVFDFNFAALVQKIYDFGLSKDQVFVLFNSIVLLILVEFFQEFYQISIRDTIDKLPLLLRWALYILFICIIVVFGHYGPHLSPVDFIYEHF